MAEFSKLNGYTVKDVTARNIAKGRNQALAYSDYATMVETLNAMDNEQFKIGQNIYIGTVGVPDLWVYSVEPIMHDFAHVSDEETVELLKDNGTIQVGYYKLAMLEGQKVDLTPVNEQLSEHANAIAANTTAIAEQNTNLGDKGLLPYPNSSIAYNIKQINAKLNNQPATVLSGTLSVQEIASGATRVKTITFSKPFSSAPKVSVTSSNYQVNVVAQNITAGFFEVKCTTSSGNWQTTTVSWSASLENK